MYKQKSAYISISIDFLTPQFCTIVHMKENREEILAARQRCRFWMNFSMMYKAASVFANIVTTERERLEKEERAQRVYNARQSATLVIQKNLSIKYDKFQVLQKVLRTQQLFANSRNREMLAKGRQTFDSREEAASVIVFFLKECKTSFLLLARTHMVKIKTVQNYARAFRRITLERSALICTLLDVFYHQLLVHLHIGEYHHNIC